MAARRWSLGISGTTACNSELTLVSCAPRTPSGVEARTRYACSWSDGRRDGDGALGAAWTVGGRDLEALTNVTDGGTFGVLVTTGTTAPLGTAAVGVAGAGTQVAGEAPLELVALGFGSGAVVPAGAAPLPAGPSVRAVLDASGVAIEVAAVSSATCAFAAAVDPEEDGLAEESGGGALLAAGVAVAVELVPGSVGALASGVATAGGPGVGAVASGTGVAGSAVPVEIAFGPVVGPAAEGAVAVASPAGVSASAADDPAQLRISVIRQRSAKRGFLRAILVVPREPSR